MASYKTKQDEIAPSRETRYVRETPVKSAKTTAKKPDIKDAPVVFSDWASI